MVCVHGLWSVCRLRFVCPWTAVCVHGLWSVCLQTMVCFSIDRGVCVHRLWCGSPPAVCLIATDAWHVILHSIITVIASSAQCSESYVYLCVCWRRKVFFCGRAYGLLDIFLMAPVASICPAFCVSSCQCVSFLLFEFLHLLLVHSYVPSVHWRCWLGGRKCIRPVKSQWWVLVWLSGQRAVKRVCVFVTCS